MNFDHGMAGSGLSVISLTPVEIRGHIWVCIGFEPIDAPMGDAPHLAFIHAQRDWLAEPDLHAAVRAEMTAGGLLARIHSECILGDAFGSSMCDCGEQLRLSMDEMMRAERGVFIYLRQEGRGIGLRNKLDVLALQYGFMDGLKVTRRHSSDEANLALGFKVDHRSYDVAAALLRALGVVAVRLVTGNPDKIADLEAEGIVVDEVIDLFSDVGVSARAAAEIEEKVARGYMYRRHQEVIPAGPPPGSARAARTAA